MLQLVLPAIVLASAWGQEVYKKAYGNQDMFAESTIVRQGYAYPGLGGEGVGYGSSIGYTNKFTAPFYGPEKFGPGGGGVGFAEGGYYPGPGIKYGYEQGPVAFGYQGPVGPKYGGGYLTEEKYPVGFGIQPKLVPIVPKVPVGIGAGGLGYAGPGYVGGPGFVGAGPVGPIGYGGGEFVNKNVYGGGQKELKDQRFEKSHGKKGEEFEEGKEGFNHGKVAVKNVKGDSGYYSDEEGGKKLAEDEKKYYGGHHYAQQGQNGEEKKVKQGHRKGHTVKGFKKSHHKDESGHEENYYDEEHDEGENAHFNEQGGSFGEKEGSSYKGAHEDGEFKANQGKKEGHYDNHHLVDNNGGEGGQYGSKKYGSSGTSYGVNNGADEQSLLGHQEHTKFVKHHPEHVPFFSSRYYKK